MIIREATKEDVPKILPIWRELMEFHARRDAYWTLCEGAEEVFSNHLMKKIDKEDAFVLVAQDNDTIIAYCLCSIEERPPIFEIQRQYGHLSDLAVLKTHRRNGLGKQMVQRAMKWFAEQKMERIEVRVAITNEISTQFWRKMGFAAYLETMCKAM